VAFSAPEYNEYTLQMRYGQRLFGSAQMQRYPSKRLGTRGVKNLVSRRLKQKASLK
jgi:hypothetical protein